MDTEYDEYETLDQKIDYIFTESEKFSPMDNILKKVLKKYVVSLKNICLEGLSEEQKFNEVINFIEKMEKFANAFNGYKNEISPFWVEYYLDNKHLLDYCFPIIKEYLVDVTDEKVNDIIYQIHRVLIVLESEIQKNKSIDRFQSSQYFKVIHVISLIVVWCIFNEEKGLLCSVKTFIKNNQSGISDFEQYHSLIKKFEDKFDDVLSLNRMYEVIYVQLCDLEIDTKIKI